MSNASPGTEPATLPTEGHQLLYRREADAEITRTTTEYTKLHDEDDQSWGSDTPTLRAKPTRTAYEEWERAKQREKKQQTAASNRMDATTDTFAGFGLDDNVLRHSYKGTPPEIYSPKKEFIYTQPLVEKQLVLKKTCEWLFYKIKYNMSTHWRQSAFVIALVTTVIFVIIGLIFGLSSPPSSSTSIRLDQINADSSGISGPRQFINDTTVINWSDDGSDIERDDDIGVGIGVIEDIGDDNLNDTVTPIKQHNISLNYEDLLYESKRHSDSNSSNQRDATSSFSQTGTFRSKTNKIWDPHPEYKLEMFGRVLHLKLSQDSSFVPSKTFRIINILHNRTEELEADNDLGCIYSGRVEGDSQSRVGVSLCGGMTGYIKTSFGSLLIQPLVINQTNSDPILHRVWRHSLRNRRHAVSDLDMALEAFELGETTRPRLTRNKRHYPNQSNQVYTLEVLIAVDNTMLEFHKSDLTSYILTLFSIVSNIFADASIGNSIQISVVNLLSLRDNIPNSRAGNRRHGSPSDKLKHFCSFLSKKGFHYDTAMLITRNQICDNEREERCNTLGLAELGTVCKERSCSIAQDNGLPAAFTIAHELGHILNMPHDDDDRCKGHITKTGNNRTLHIMSSVMGTHMHPWSWSKCSRHYVSEFLEKMDKSCLENTPSSFLPNLNSKLPGEIYSLDHQCQLIYGNQSTQCDHNYAECKYLYCKDNDACHTSSMPWADGTPCNNGRYWCQRGKCESRMASYTKVVNGGWGPWSPFTPCSLTCGGGVQESRRECDSPQPANNGKFCVGSRKKYRSCNTHACPAGTMDPRERQCYDMNGKNFNIPGISPHSKWIPKYGLNAHVADKCKLYCRLADDSAYFLLEEKVIDGTTCTVDSFDKCVNGICRPAGCDNELNSIAKLDRCGVCEGKNDTCATHTGSIQVADLLRQKRPPSSLFPVTTIPKGASNIFITQTGYPDQNYIVLSDDRHVALLNSDKVVTPYPKKYSYAGVTIDYNGSNSTEEQVSTTYSFKTTRDLIVELISIDLSAAKNQQTVLITYTYTLDLPRVAAEPEVEIYRWQMQAWGNCDSLCQGTMHRQAVCVSITQGVKVASQFCDGSAMPKPEYRSCNTECELTLNTTSISECSASCGELGTREKTLSCIQTIPNIPRSNIVDMSYCELKFEIVRHEQCREGCWNYTDWSTCTKTCGTGTQVREVRCYLNGMPVSDELCNRRTKEYLNDNLRTCNMEPCRFYPDVTINTRSVNHWMAGEWGECSDWCKMNRTVTCTSPYGNQCPLDKKPKNVRNCCHIKYTSEWEQCSVECGTGKKHKVQRCARVYKPEVPGAPKRRVYVDDSFCTTLKVRKPRLRKSTKICKIKCQWKSSPWTPCSKDCTEDYQSRYVRCEAFQGNMVSDHHCDVKRRPSRRRFCSECVQQQLQVLTPCDCMGYERYRIIYRDSHGRRVGNRAKENRRKCKPPPSCASGGMMAAHNNIGSSYNNAEKASRSAQSCADLKRMYGIDKDGEYTIQVRFRPVRIYCHQMRSAAPREYITVQPQENYSIYYEYKTLLLNSCPPTTRAHEYANDQNSGRTHFNKLRLNITDLRIIENDFEFSQSRGQRQSLGSAGDCYNQNTACPQGDFSISLQRTGFQLRPGTVWNTYGNRAVMQRASGFDTSSLSRRAFCGGFCGRCSIAPSSGLYVDVV
ncbi:LOW QUALITY PROTEIN: A disintegrin and metalloproteinase with thrombospondin motifs 9 [Drosophila sulfurigaster albostrigata]|uniref:LOW QUALITY PROTEIN: A disintegrin and metalloproteinase with thrombospondin motifs 9 n=1 Tax=Drosophila sulfurigaster albostrigata TaxID=89887 RepID=UPI002D21C8BD|nr:LOW QUALITY PROTEIN: A disintegrin and metalloproteinase with thrombospondin motifs 9 [Drosophila sulfurigaster albostrigata]